MHGKGVVDGVGAAVKGLAGKKVKTRKMEIRSSQDFEKALEGSSVTVFSMSEKEKEERNESLKLKQITSKARAIKEISKFHSFKNVNGVIIGEKISKFDV